MKKLNVEHLKNKITCFCVFEAERGKFIFNMYRFLDCDGFFLKVQSWRKIIYYIPLSVCLAVEEPNNEQVFIEARDKFLRYEKKYEKDKNFEADEEDEDKDKGYTFIKKVKIKKELNSGGKK